MSKIRETEDRPLILNTPSMDFLNDIYDLSDINLSSWYWKGMIDKVRNELSAAHRDNALLREQMLMK